MGNFKTLSTIPKKSCVFDLEADGLLDKCSVVHSLVIFDLDTQELFSYANQIPFYKGIEEGLSKLNTYDYIIGHNIICFDLPVIDKLFGMTIKGFPIDTYNLSTLIYTNLKMEDYTVNRFKVPDHIKGHHTLESWGYRIGKHKGNFGKLNDWKLWTQEMQDYCEQDVLVNVELFKHFLQSNYSMTAIELEMKFQQFISVQERCGVDFNEVEAKKLSKFLTIEQTKIDMEIASIIPPKEVQLKTKVKIVPFNPNSRDQIVKHFIDKYGWMPEKLSKKTSKPTMNEEVLSALTFPEVEIFKKRFAVSNLRAKLEVGNKSWLKHAKKGKIHGRVITNGAVTGRCTHSSPNLAQCTSPRKPYGLEARSLFYVPEGFKLVGADAAGLELRCLAHYLYAYDNGRFAEIVCDGDIHTANQQAAELPTRDDAKRFIYAFNYGAGDELLGGLVDGNLTVNQKKILGRSVRGRFLSRTPGLANLIQDVKNTAKARKYLRGIDGRRLFVRSQHMALNTLLQGAGAVIMKQAAVNFWDSRNLYLPNYEEVVPVLNVHDEIQCKSPEVYAESVGILLVEGIRNSGDIYNFKCKLDGKYKIGNNWGETH